MGDVINMFKSPPANEEGNKDVPTSTETKKAVFLACMAEKETYLSLDATREDVVVPDEYRKMQGLTLKFSYKYRNEQLDVDHLAIRGTLSFGGMSKRVLVPWSAIWRIKDALWPKDVPPAICFVINAPNEPKTCS